MRRGSISKTDSIHIIVMPRYPQSGFLGLDIKDIDRVIRRPPYNFPTVPGKSYGPNLEEGQLPENDLHEVGRGTPKWG